MSVAKIITKRAAKVIGWNKQERLYIVMTVKADINTNEFAHLIYQKTFLPLHWIAVTPGYARFYHAAWNADAV